MAESVVESRKEMWLVCGACEHRWVGCLLPMEISKFAKMMKQVMCPSCGADSKQIFCSSQAALSEGGGRETGAGSERFTSFGPQPHSSGCSCKLCR